ncbi:hypothetical protein JW707_05295 [Candidatus Woesearchaeota archaeon]|nr:hypothetical protein [Candidatus Woesearchaeota archaeon]
MKTYLIMYFGSGMPASDVAKKLKGLGFEAHYGPYDFIYDWKKNPTKDEILALGDKVAEALKGSGGVFNLDTRD